jgi:transcriptional regulator with XRE-family HTH domain
MVFIRNLRNERKRLRLTQDQLAAKSRISLSYFRAIELGSKFPGLENLEKIAQALGIAPYRLFLDGSSSDEVPSSVLLDRFVEFLVERYKKDLGAAKTEFLKGLESQKEIGGNPFEGEEMFQE